MPSTDKETTRRPAPDASALPPARELLKVLRAFRRGDFGARLTGDYSGVAGEVASALNDVIELNEALTGELARISSVVGKEGRLGQRAAMPRAGGSWQRAIDSVNELVVDLVQPTTEVGRVIGAVAAGDLSQKMTLEIDGRPLKGQFLSTAKVVNGMVEQLGLFASEVTRVAR